MIHPRRFEILVCVFLNYWSCDIIFEESFGSFFTAAPFPTGAQLRPFCCFPLVTAPKLAPVGHAVLVPSLQLVYFQHHRLEIAEWQTSRSAGLCDDLFSLAESSNVLMVVHVCPGYPNLAEISHHSGHLLIGLALNLSPDWLFACAVFCEFQ